MYFVMKMDSYYPMGGLEDSVFQTDDLDMAREWNDQHERGDWGYILDGLNGEKLHEWSKLNND